MDVIRSNNLILTLTFAATMVFSTQQVKAIHDLGTRDGIVSILCEMPQYLEGNDQRACERLIELVFSQQISEKTIKQTFANAHSRNLLDVYQNRLKKQCRNTQRLDNLITQIQSDIPWLLISGELDSIYNRVASYFNSLR